MRALVMRTSCLHNYVLLTNVLAFIKDSGIIGTGPSDHYLAYFVFNTKLMCPKAIPLKFRPESLPLWPQHSAFLGCVHFWQLWCLLMLGTTLKSSSRWPGASIIWEYDQLKKKYSKSRIKSRGLGKVPIVQEKNGWHEMKGIARSFSMTLCREICGSKKILENDETLP